MKAADSVVDRLRARCKEVVDTEKDSIPGKARVVPV